MRAHNLNLKHGEDLIALGHITHALRMQATWAVIAKDGDLYKLVALCLDPGEAVATCQALSCHHIINLKNLDT